MEIDSWADHRDDDDAERRRRKKGISVACKRRVVPPLYDWINIWPIKCNISVSGNINFVFVFWLFTILQTAKPCFYIFFSPHSHQIECFVVLSMDEVLLCGYLKCFDRFPTAFWIDMAKQKMKETMRISLWIALTFFRVLDSYTPSASGLMCCYRYSCCHCCYHHTAFKWWTR